MVESNIVFLNIWPHVWGIIDAVRPSVVLDIAIDEVLGALSMHVAPWPYGLLWYPQL
jgi:hypothetical protein